MMNVTGPGRSVPLSHQTAGEFGYEPDSLLRFVMNWNVRNDGEAPGRLGAHIIIQERGGFLGQEQRVIEAEANGVLRTDRLSVPLNQSVPSRTIGWDPGVQTLTAGQVTAIRGEMTVGMDLLRGKGGLDVVVIVRNLEDGSEVGQHRYGDFFAVTSERTFGPVAIGRPDLRVTHEAIPTFSEGDLFRSYRFTNGHAQKGGDQ